MFMTIFNQVFIRYHTYIRTKKNSVCNCVCTVKDARNNQIEIINGIEFNGARLGCNFEKRTLMYRSRRDIHL